MVVHETAFGFTIDISISLYQIIGSARSLRCPESNVRHVKKMHRSRRVQRRSEFLPFIFTCKYKIRMFIRVEIERARRHSILSVLIKERGEACGEEPRGSRATSLAHISLGPASKEDARISEIAVISKFHPEGERRAAGWSERSTRPPLSRGFTSSASKPGPTRKKSRGLSRGRAPYAVRRELFEPTPIVSMLLRFLFASQSGKITR